tara:strand:+ start:437 stop:964 length:528 start_codon:yes stop_codon:yes gene_type:complete
MKILIWVLNIIQFIIVYFLIFSLFFTGFFQVIDPSIGLSGENFWPLMSIGIAGVPWKYYNRFSLFITSKKMKAPAVELVGEEAYNTNEKKGLDQSKTKRPEVLYTFFFGYFSLKWRRLIRVLILVTLIILPPLIIINPSKEISDSAIFACLIFTLVLLIPVILISWVVKPFVVKE